MAVLRCALRLCVLTGLAAGAGAGADAPAAAPAPPPQAQVCAGCHGPDGNAPNPAWPKLAGQQAVYLSKQLRDFQTGRRTNPVMAPMAMAVPPPAVDQVAAYFASLPIRPGGPAAGDPERGRQLYLEGRPENKVLPCVSCHGLRGEGFPVGVEGGFPALGGQHAAYLEQQLRAFRDGSRANDWQGIMQLVARGLSDRDIADVAAYLAALSRDEPAPAAGAAAATGGDATGAEPPAGTGAPPPASR